MTDDEQPDRDAAEPEIEIEVEDEAEVGDDIVADVADNDADAPRPGPPRWIWIVAAVVVIVGFGIAIAVAGSTDDSSSTSPSTTPSDTVPADLRTVLGREILPGLDGFRVVAPASGSELLSRSDIAGRAGTTAPAVPLPGGGAQAGWRRDFTATTGTDVVRVVLLHMKTAAEATRARDDLQQWWVRQQGTVLDDRVPVGSTDVVVGASKGADANGDHAQIAIGAVGRTVFIVLRFSKDAATDTAALLRVAADQAVRLQAG
jgi:hypothetical protein